MTQQPPDRRALAVPSSRIARFSKLGSMTAGIAGNMAMDGMGQLSRGQRPSFRTLLLTPQNVSRIAEQLAQMRGAAMKIGQMLSMDTGDALPPELAQIMARLRSDAHFMPPAQLKQVFNQQWPPDWLKQFKNFNVRPIAAASIGQVHRATLKDGRDLAIKVQYPGVAKSIDSDVANVGALIKMTGLLPKGFELAPYLEEARLQLHDETDYALEGRNLVRFKTLLAGDSRFELPDLHQDWTTPDVLAMSFIDSIPIEDIADAQQETRDAIATALIELMFCELFDFGVMQTDPNFANYRYNTVTEKIVLLDFGATRDLSPAIARQYKQLLRAGLQRDRGGLRDLSKTIGFFVNETEERYKGQILDMMQTIFAALLAQDTFDFSRSSIAQDLQAQGMQLAEDGFVPPPLPIDVLFLQRKFGGMFLLASRLGARVRVAEILTRILDRDIGA